MAIKRIDPGARLSQAVVHGDTIYVAGQVAADTGADCAGQTRQILNQIDALLAQGGSDKTRILWANVWLADMGDYSAMNGEWNRDPQGPDAARATVGRTRHAAVQGRSPAWRRQAARRGPRGQAFPRSQETGRQTALTRRKVAYAKFRRIWRRVGRHRRGRPPGPLRFTILNLNGL
jgi:enamine deaminase RidA (YjgF/YER057c/UK114 family)